MLTNVEAQQAQQAQQSSFEHSVITVKNWHVVLILISWVVVVAMAFSQLQSATNENSRRIAALEVRESVTPQQYQEGQRALERRLERIENKLDQADAAQHHH